MGSFFETCKIVTSGFYNLLFYFLQVLMFCPSRTGPAKPLGVGFFVFLISFCFYIFYCPVFISAQSLLVLPILVQLPW